MFNFTFSMEQVNIILRHLDMGAHREVRPMIDLIITETNRQQQEQSPNPTPPADPAEGVMKPDTITFMSTTNRLNETTMSTAETCKLSEVIEVFERFLRGAGWDFDGHLVPNQPELPTYPVTVDTDNPF